MKNMSRKFQITLTITVVFIISFGLIVITNMVTSPIIESRQREQQIAQYEILFKDIDHFETVVSSETFEATFAYDENNNTLGVMYHSMQTNAYGDMTIAFSVDASGTIVHAYILEYNQTESLKSIVESNVQLFIGLNLGDLPSRSDLTSGATRSYDATTDAFLEGKSHFDTLDLKPKDPFSVMAQGYAYKVVDETFVSTEHVINKHIIYDDYDFVLGYIYTLYGSGPYQDGGEDKDIQYYVAIDDAHTILGVLVLDEEYHHSGGVFYSRIKAYLDSFVGQTLEALSYDVDWVSGATSGNSKALVDTLMNALVEVLS